MSPSLQHRVLLAATGAWLGLIVLGLGVLIRYSLKPGSPGTPPAVWPPDSRLERTVRQYNLVLAAHPHCPCSRASLSELDAIMARCQGRLVARVLFLQPEGFSEAWARSDLWRQAEAIPGVVPVLDPRGLEALRFGALTSGQTALYGPDGRLVFSGGITGARGHSGANAGRSAVVARVERSVRVSTTTQSPVYGCPLEGPPSMHGKETHACPRS